jgi:hypothetical protein
MALQDAATGKSILAELALVGASAREMGSAVLKRPSLKAWQALPRISHCADTGNDARP